MNIPSSDDSKADELINPKSTSSSSKRNAKVSYFYKADVGHYYYGAGHPMKPHRLRLTTALVLSFGLYRKMKVYSPHRCSSQEMEKFHLHDYVNFLRKVSPLTQEEFERQANRFAVGPNTDCPIFDGLYEFMSVCAGGSVDAAMIVNHGDGDDVVINWSGGLHHAKKAEASGFCYINDIVLCILELLKYHPRVLYIDIDIHHGDGVEEAFYTTNRVMTCSFHKYGDFFPGTGAITDIGYGAGKYCSVNVPLHSGLDDISFETVFKPVITKIMQTYQPGAVVMCCGADSITGDRIGVWNMSVKGHAGAIDFVKSFNLPMVLLGGGGYTPRNVARCWSYETAVAIGCQNELNDVIPMNEYYTSFGPNYTLHVVPDASIENKNQKSQLDAILETVITNLNELKGPPSVQIQEVPPDFYTSHAARKRKGNNNDDAGEEEGEGEEPIENKHRSYLLELAEHTLLHGEKEEGMEEVEEAGMKKAPAQAYPPESVCDAGTMLEDNNI